MTKKIITISTILSFAFSAVPVLAVPTFDLPQAADHSAVISLGTAFDPGSGKIVEGLMFIHYKKDNAKPPWAGGGGKGGGDKTSTCYSFLAKDAKWKTVEPWLVNTANSEGLSSDFVFSNLDADITKWEDAAGFNILGSGSVTSDVLVADTVKPDGLNEVYFADVSSVGAIAVTIVWGRFGGRPANRELVEWDMIFDDVDYDWSSVGEEGKMDFENIATHELGHVVGMGHPDDSCAEETMYRYAGFGETKKQTLEAGDIAGVSKLY